MTERPLVLVHDPSPLFDYHEEREIIEAAGAELLVPESDVARDAALPTAAVLLVTGHQSLTAEQVAAAARCVGIQTASTGTDFISPAAAERGLPVRSSAGYCTTEVADHAMTLLLSLERRLFAVDRATRSGDRTAVAAALAPIRRLGGRTLGVLGFGRIGQQVALRARAFGYRVVAFDPYAAPEAAEFGDLVTFEELLGGADAIVSCAPLTAETAHLLDAAAFERMRDGVIIVNVSRGGIIREPDLVAALDGGRVAVAALDVRDGAVPSPDPLAGRDDVILTPHMAATSIDAVEELHVVCAEGCVRLLREAGLLPGGSSVE